MAETILHIKSRHVDHLILDSCVKYLVDYDLENMALRINKNSRGYFQKFRKFGNSILNYFQKKRECLTLLHSERF